MLKQKKNEKGFTIIEVMIVLAIAGLIMLVVFLAVPALQRNSRNTALKNDASAIGGAITEFSSNNNGAVPTVGGSEQNDAEVTIGGSGSTTASTAKVQAGTAVEFGAPSGSDEPGTLYVVYGEKCQSDNGHDTDTSRRATAILYNIETSSGVAPKCLDS